MRSCFNQTPSALCKITTSQTSFYRPARPHKPVWYIPASFPFYSITDPTFHASLTELFSTSSLHPGLTEPFSSKLELSYTPLSSHTSLHPHRSTTSPFNTLGVKPPLRSRALHVLRLAAVPRMSNSREFSRGCLPLLPTQPTVGGRVCWLNNPPSEPQTPDPQCTRSYGRVIGGRGEKRGGMGWGGEFTGAV